MDPGYLEKEKNIFKIKLSNKVRRGKTEELKLRILKRILLIENYIKLHCSVFLERKILYSFLPFQ